MKIKIMTAHVKTDITYSRSRDRRGGRRSEQLDPGWEFTSAHALMNNIWTICLPRCPGAHQRCKWMHTLSFLLTDDYWYVQLEAPPSVPCYWIMHDYEVEVCKCTHMITGGRQESWCPAAECGGTSEFSMGKVKYFGRRLSDFTPPSLECLINIPLRSQPELKIHYQQTPFFFFFLPQWSVLVSLLVISWPPHVSQPRWVGAGRSDPPNTQPRLTLMHHSLTGTKERNAENRREREGGAIHLLQHSTVQ